MNYRRLADIRFALRSALSHAEAACRSIGIEPAHHAALVQIRGLEGPVTIGRLAQRLQVRHHTAVELVDRMCEAGLIQRRRNAEDGRLVEVRLTGLGRLMLRRLARADRKLAGALS